MVEFRAVTATIPIADLSRSREFYEDKLGLTLASDGPAGATYRIGSGMLLVFPSSAPGGGGATSAVFTVPNVAEAVEELKAKGVVFEVYPDMPVGTWDGEVLAWPSDVVGGGAPAHTAWFKDPDGNLLALDDAS